MSDRATRSSRGGGKQSKRGKATAASQPSTSTSPTKKPAEPLDMENPPTDTPEDAKVEEEEEIFLTAITPSIITDGSCKTFIFKNEGHTLGNALRFVISHYPEVKFIGHTIPHPSEDEMHLRIQTTPGTSVVDTLRKGLQDLVAVCEHTETVFDQAMSKWNREHPDKDLFQVPAPPGPRH